MSKKSNTITNTKVDDSPTKTLAGIRRITEECVEDTGQQKNQTTRLIAYPPYMTMLTGATPVPWRGLMAFMAMPLPM